MYSPRLTSTGWKHCGRNFSATTLVVSSDDRGEHVGQALLNAARGLLAAGASRS
jgi:ribosomal protein S18 acetylase RimI-like enzyme